MTKFRTTGHDVMPPPIKRSAKPGAIGQWKLGVYDHGPDGELRLRGQVGPKMTSSGVSRFHGKLGSTVRTVAGRKAWVAPTSKPDNAIIRSQKSKLATSLKMDRGSVSSK